MQHNTHLEYKHTDIHAKSRVWTHDLSVSVSERVHTLDRLATVVGSIMTNRYISSTNFRGLQSASELYRRSSRRLSAKLVLTFVDRGRNVVIAIDPDGRILGFLDRNLYFLFQATPQLYS
jgi:hypothetical protein